MNTMKTLLFGVALGATLGVLFAPRKGETTRRMLFRRAKEGEREVSETLNEVADDLVERSDRLKKVGQRAARRQKAVVGQAVKEAQVALATNGH